MRVIGIDPGKKLTWTIVDVTEDRCLWVDSGAIVGDTIEDVEPQAWELVCQCRGDKVQLVAFELYDPGEWIGGARAGAAVATWQHAAMVAGCIMGQCGTPVRVYSAQTWRRGTIGDRTASDSQIKHWLTQWGRIELPKRTNADQRDAAGLAIYAGRLEMDRLKCEEWKEVVG